MKKLTSLILGSLLPTIVSAQNWDVPLSDDGVVYASLFAGNLSLLLSIVIGFIATVLVFRAARKMGGGLFGIVMNYIGAGMALVIIGSISSVLSPWLPQLWLSIINTTCFAVGYIFMVLGANKLLKGIINT